MKTILSFVDNNRVFQKVKFTYINGSFAILISFLNFYLLRRKLFIFPERFPIPTQFFNFCRSLQHEIHKKVFRKSNNKNGKGAIDLNT